MRLPLFLFAFPALLGALGLLNVSPKRYFVPVEVPEGSSRMFAANGTFNPSLRNHTINDFVKIYVKLLKTLINTKTPKAYQDHNAYLGLELLFSECYAPQFQDYKMLRKWLEQFVLHHSDAKIKVLSIRGDNEVCEMRLRFDVMTTMNMRLKFDMEFRAFNENQSGWSILFIDRNIGCQ